MRFALRFGATAGGLALLAGALSPLAAQDCDLVSSITSSATNRGTPYEIVTVTGGVISCPGGKRLAAGTIISNKASGVINLIGDVQYSDGERTLTAANATYDKAQSRILANGNVVVRERDTGSTLRGQTLEYDQATRGREARMKLLPSTPRPSALLVNTDAGGRTDTTRVEADMLETFGETRFRGTGGATLKRDSLNAFGGILDYDERAGTMQLTVQARIEGPKYSLVGDSIRATIQRDTVRDVSATGNGVLTSENVTAEAPFLLLGLQGGQLHRMIAVRRGAAGTRQALVKSETFRLLADSIDVLAPGEQLERVFAVGRAYGQVLDTLPPVELGAELQGTLDSDWMKGDTVQAFFAVNPRAATDTAAAERVLERVVTVGEPASSLYRKRGETTSPAPTAGATPAPSTQAYDIGYILAKRIEVTMAEGEVAQVKASEDVRGTYVQPRSSGNAQARRGTNRNR